MISVENDTNSENFKGLSRDFLMGSATFHGYYLDKIYILLTSVSLVNRGQEENQLVHIVEQILLY
jgi:hypothetical protein